MKGPGGVFERQILASMPDWAGLYARKVPDPPARRFACPKCKNPMATACPACGTAQPHQAKFFRPNPWDIEIRMRSEHGLVEVLLECKSTGPSRLAYNAVKDHQKDALSHAARVGSIAGVLWEPRRDIALTGALFIPIATFLGLEARSERKSIPVKTAQEVAVSIEIDTARGRTHRYYRMDRFLALLR